MASKQRPNPDVDLRACTNGDKQAWDGFVARWSGLIYTAVRHVVQRTEIKSSEGGGAGIEIDDATQEVFVRLVKNDFRLLKSFDPQRATLSTWLTIVSRSVAIDCMRRKRLITTTLEAHHAKARPDEGSIVHDDMTQPASAGTGLPMHLLTERQRLVLGMLFDEGLSVSQTARRMGVDDQTIRSTKHKALTRLRQHFGVDAQT